MLEEEVNRLALLNPVRWIDFVFEAANGLLDFIASRGGIILEINGKMRRGGSGNFLSRAYHIATEFFWRSASAVIRLPITLLQNLINIVFHPWNTFIKPYADIYGFFSAHKNDIHPISKLKIAFLMTMQTLKVVTILTSIMLGIGIVGILVGGPFAPFAIAVLTAINSIPIFSFLPALVGIIPAIILPTAIASSLAIEVCKTGADLSTSEKGLSYLSEKPARKEEQSKEPAKIKSAESDAFARAVANARAILPEIDQKFRESEKHLAQKQPPPPAKTTKISGKAPSSDTPKPTN